MLSHHAFRQIFTEHLLCAHHDTYTLGAEQRRKQAKLPLHVPLPSAVWREPAGFSELGVERLRLPRLCSCPSLSILILTRP